MVDVVVVALLPAAGGGEEEEEGGASPCCVSVGSAPANGVIEDHEKNNAPRKRDNSLLLIGDAFIAYYPIDTNRQVSRDRCL